MTTFFRRALSVFALSLAAVSALWAQEPINRKEDYNINPDRPSVAFAPNVVPVGAFQFETGYFWSRSNSRDIDAQQYEQNLPTITFRTGITPRLEAIVGWNLASSRSVLGGVELENRIYSNALTVGTRVAIIDKADGNIPQLAFFAAVELPFTMPASLRRGASPSAMMFFTGQNEWGKLTFFYNAGAYFYEESDGLRTYMQTDASLMAGIEYFPIKKFGFFAEAYNSMPFHNFRYRQAFDGGLMYVIKGRYLFDVGVGVELDKYATTPFFTVGFSACL